MAKNNRSRLPVVPLRGGPANPPPETRRLPRREIKDVSQISNTKIEMFLTTYEKTMDFSDACRISGVPTRLMKRLIQEQPVVVERMEEIEHKRLDQLEALLFKDALESPEDRKWVLSRLRRGKWGSGGSGGSGTTINTNIQINAGTPRELTDEELMRIATQGRVPVQAKVEEE